MKPGTLLCCACLLVAPLAFAAEAERPYGLRTLPGGKEGRFSGQELRAGISIAIEPRAELRLAVRPLH